ncbi:MAG: hypothetical protein AB8G22_27720, partial [Saprospiraceae bacterium]
MKKSFIFLVSLSFLINVTAQIRLDVAGDAKIQGKLELIQAPGDSSIFIGPNAGINDDGTDNRNTFLGTNAGEFNTSGFNNIFIGNYAGRKNTTSSNNTYVGYLAGSESTTSLNNTYVGTFAGIRNTGSSNTFIG